MDRSSKIFLIVFLAIIGIISIPIIYHLMEPSAEDLISKYYDSDNLKNRIIPDTVSADNQNKYDSVKIKELSPLFKFKKDEFESTIWVIPKNAPKFINSNGIYLYFQSSGKYASNLRLKYQYYADDWLFIKKIQFLVDGSPYEYIPFSMKSDNGDGYIWEWFDDLVTSEYSMLFSSLHDAKTVKMKLIGTDYHKVITLNKDQIKSLKNSLDLFFAMGGKIPLINPI